MPDRSCTSPRARSKCRGTVSTSSANCAELDVMPMCAVSQPSAPAHSLYRAVWSSCGDDHLRDYNYNHHDENGWVFLFFSFSIFTFPLHVFVPQDKAGMVDFCDEAIASDLLLQRFPSTGQSPALFLVYPIISLDILTSHESEKEEETNKSKLVPFSTYVVNCISASTALEVIFRWRHFPWLFIPKCPDVSYHTC